MAWTDFFFNVTSIGKVAAAKGWTRHVDGNGKTRFFEFACPKCGTSFREFANGRTLRFSHCGKTHSFTSAALAKLPMRTVQAATHHNMVFLEDGPFKAKDAGAWAIFKQPHR